MGCLGEARIQVPFDLYALPEGQGFDFVLDEARCVSILSTAFHCLLVMASQNTPANQRQWQRYHPKNLQMMPTFGSSRLAAEDLHDGKTCCGFCRESKFCRFVFDVEQQLTDGSFNHSHKCLLLQPMWFLQLIWFLASLMLSDLLLVSPAAMLIT